MTFPNHYYRVGMNEFEDDKIPVDDELEMFMKNSRQHIEPWLSAVFQSEHLGLLLGSGFTKAISQIAQAPATEMATVSFGSSFDALIDSYAKKSASATLRGEANIEDQIRSAWSLLEGLRIMEHSDAGQLSDAIDAQLSQFLMSLLATERGIDQAANESKITLQAYLVSFLMSFASRATSRERMHIFTTNYDRLIEYGCDLAGIRVLDRFVGALNPVFRSSRIEVDMHYNPPGIRGEPRFLEGVLRLTKLHGSIDWDFDKKSKVLSRKGIPFGAPDNHTDIPKSPLDTVMIYPNPAKDVETLGYPYAELFRDFAAAICRPNAVLVTYGYGFGDDHINRVLADMLTIPSTHLVIILFKDIGNRAKNFCEKVGRRAQISLLVGSHFGDITTLVNHYLPQSAIDCITLRQADLQRRRGEGGQNHGVSSSTAPLASDNGD